MGLDLREVECLALSHSHWDHTGGLLETLKKIGKCDLPVIIHEDMFKTRGSVNPQGSIRVYPTFPTREQLREARIIETKQPFVALDGSFVVTGEIPRKTAFEKGFLAHRVLERGKWKVDPLIADDRGLVFNVKGKGLVILSGCAHAGIINTVKYAQKITGISEIHAVMGGFHLAGRENEKRIEPTLNDLEKMNPKLLISCHCTGWKANCAFAARFLEAFVWYSVGNFYEV